MGQTMQIEPTGFPPPTRRSHHKMSNRLSAPTPYAPTPYAYITKPPLLKHAPSGLKHLKAPRGGAEGRHMTYPPYYLFFFLWLRGRCLLLFHVAKGCACTKGRGVARPSLQSGFPRHDHMWKATSSGPTPSTARDPVDPAPSPRTPLLPVLGCQDPISFASVQFSANQAITYVSHLVGFPPPFQKNLFPVLSIQSPDCACSDVGGWGGCDGHIPIK